MKKKVRAAVIGAPGYSGEELVRILSRHSSAELTYASGREDRDAKLQEIFPYLRGRVDIDCRAFSLDEALAKSDLFFLCLPHTVSMQTVPSLLAAKKKVIDIGVDYRLKDPEVFEKFYKAGHKDTQNLKHAVYGLPEVNRQKIRSASLVANPGCYPTGSILGLLPGVKLGFFEPGTLIVDAKSGVTGAGRKAEKALNFSEVNESFKAYKLFEHQHVPEIEQELSRASKKEVTVTFVPHLVPMNRGILCTIYARLAKKADTASLLAAYKKFYANEPFVKVYDDGKLPETRYVAGTNFCDIGLRVDTKKGLAVVVSAIDNLGKGAAGQAVQNMNLVCGFDETEGLL
jgi:N-acetyl-gamma-glutamyl-phosphate reductase